MTFATVPREFFSVKISMAVPSSSLPNVPRSTPACAAGFACAFPQIGAKIKPARRMPTATPALAFVRSRRWHTPGRFYLRADLGKCASKAGGAGGRGARDVWQAGGWNSHRDLHAEEFAWNGGESHYLWGDADGTVGAG